MKADIVNSIWDRLVAMGYKEDLEAMEDLSMTIYFDILPAMKGTATLTDRGKPSPYSHSLQLTWV